MRIIINAIRLYKKYSIFVIFLSTLIFHIFISSIGWNNPITDVHGFRQTQTAISTYYFIKDGVRLDYQTPVFGAPWSIPFEFPLYQTIVATVVKTTGMHLDQAGRLVTLTFFYASLGVLYILLADFGVKQSYRFLIMSLVLASPVYLFWSRTFLMESLAIFLSLTYFHGAVIIGKKPHRLYILFLTTGIGVLAALVKITTYVIFIFPSFLSFAYFYDVKIKKPGQKSKQYLLFLLMALFLFAGPLMVGKAWINYTDKIKSQNPFAADFITSNALTYWNFGNMAQRFRLDTWQIIGRLTQITTIGSLWLIGGILLVSLFSKKYRLLILGSMLTFFSGPLIFTNLYYIHDYYYYANSFFLLTALGFSLVALLEIKKFQLLVKYFLCPLILLFLLKTYKDVYYVRQYTNSYTPVELGEVVEFFTQPDDIILVYGYDWNSELAYYAHRKAFMDRWKHPLTHPKFLHALATTGKDRITAMFVPYYSEQFIKDRVNFFNFYPKPVFQNSQGSIYVKNTKDNEIDKKISEINKLIIYRSISNIIPDKVTSTNWVERRWVDDKKILFVHAPGELLLTLPTNASSLQAYYGIMPQAWDSDKDDAADGVIFSVDSIENGKAKNLFTRQLTPLKNSKDKQMQTLSVVLPKNCTGCQLSLKTLPGANLLWDWSYWTGIEIK